MSTDPGVRDKALRDIRAQLIGRFDVERAWEYDGATESYRAIETSTGKAVLVTAVLPEMDKRERFLLHRNFPLVQFDHPSIQRLMACDVDGAIPYWVGEFLDGITLDHHGRRLGPMQPTEVFRLARDVALGLAHAHSRHVIHRDLTAGNIKVVNGHAVMCDFGLASFVARLPKGDVPKFAFPMYISPEGLSGELVTGKADVYSLGVTMFMLLTGRHPLSGSSTIQLFTQLVRGPLPRPSEFRAELPASVDEIVARAMAVDPQHRFSADELVKALDGHLGR